MISQWSNCPFCNKTFRVEKISPTIVLDGMRRRVCEPCAARVFVQVTKSNGEYNGRENHTD